MGTFLWMDELEMMIQAVRMFGRGRYDKRTLVSEILFNETLDVERRVFLITAMRVEEDSDEFKDRLVLEKMGRL